MTDRRFDTAFERYRRALRDGDYELALECEVRLGMRPGAEQRGRLSPLEARRFMLSGNAYLTVVNLNARVGDHAPRRTYRVRWWRKRGGRFFIDYLYGQDNNADYSHLGCLVPTDGRLRMELRNDVPQALEFKVLADHLKLEARYDVPFLPHGWAVYHEGRCGRCGRRLTVPESIVSGIGPECRNKATEEGVWTLPGGLLVAEQDPGVPKPPADKPFLKGLVDE